MRMGWNNLLIYLAVILVTGIGAYMDLKNHKIYNKLTMPSILLGMAYHLLTGGLKGLAGSLIGVLVGFTFAIFWILGMLKAGDVKLYMAVGAIAGWRFCGYTMIGSVLIGGIAAFFFLITRKMWRASWQRLKDYLICLLVTRRFVPYRPEEQNAYFSFGTCIFAGALAAAWYFGR